MKLLKKRPVAVVLVLVMIAAAVAIGRWKGTSVPISQDLDQSLSLSGYENWISDGADVLSASQERQICIYNANWIQRYNSLIAVATVTSVSEISRTTPMTWAPRSSSPPPTASWWWTPGQATATWPWGPTIP